MRAIIVMVMCGISLLADEGSQAVQDNLNLVWIMIASALVFFMQAGFTFVETGTVRAKNSISVAMKNVADMIFSIAAYFFVGYGLMFGITSSGLFGTSNFMLSDFSTNADYTFFIFQAVFAGTAVTIVSGAIAERMQFNAYLIMSIIVSALIYPVVGHWIWGSGHITTQAGWLGDMGFIDFAGSTVVHSVGGWVGLAGAIILGARVGRFDDKGNPVEMQPYSQTYIALGVFILWFGWFGFNGGSTLLGDGSFAKPVVNTIMSAAFGGITSFFISITFYKMPYVEKVLFGIVAGLVGVTAGCAVVEPSGAIMIGIGSSIVMHIAEELLLKLKIDDPVSAVPVHGFVGAFGTLVIPFVAPVEKLINQSRLDQFIVQLTGVVAVFFWSFILAIIVFSIFKWLKMLRVPIEHEELGLNVAEHGAKMGWYDTVNTIRSIIHSEDYDHRCNIENGTEVGEVAVNFNRLLDHITQKLDDDNRFIKEVSQLANKIKDGDLTTRIDTNTKNIQLQELKNVLNSMLDDMQNNIGKDINKIVNVMDKFANYDFTHSINEPYGKLEHIINKLGIDTSKMLHTNMINGKELQKDANLLEKNMHTLTTSSHQQSLSLEESKDEIQKITNTIKENTSKALLMNEYASNVKKSAIEGNRLANDTANAMDSINEATNAINNAIASIESIAFQTNILSLNAAVEAATAGEAGKGFAVVAGEVRNLANRSSESAKQIKSLVETAQIKTTNGKDISTQMISGYNALNEQISRTSELITDVTQGSNNQLAGIEHINKSIYELDKMLTSTTQITATTNDIASKALTLANKLVSDTSDKKFLEKVS